MTDPPKKLVHRTVEDFGFPWLSSATEEARPMPRKGRSEEGILRALHEVESGESAVAVCRSAASADRPYASESERTPAWA